MKNIPPTLRFFDLSPVSVRRPSARRGFRCGLALLFVLLAAARPGSAQVIISEFMAANHATLMDEDGESSDWIELFNTSTNAVDLGGWHLTDDAANLTKWTFPATNLPANSFLIVWASGKNRTAPGAPLHTSFNLSADGEYLALVKPDGTTIASEFAPAFPPQYDDVSYGVFQQVAVTTLVSNTSPARIRVPSNASLGATWTQPGFDHSSWTAGTNGVGYQLSVPGFAVKNYRATIQVNSTTDAESVIANPALRSAEYAENRAVINYVSTGGGANYGNDNPFPGMVVGADDNDFVIEATAVVSIPAAGNWTFGVNSDDGFSLVVGSFTVAFTGVRGPGDTLATFNFPAPGDYSLRLVFFERGGGAEVELYAAQGAFSAWNPTNFRLVGDTAGGGLTVRSLAQGTVGYASHIRTDVRALMTNQNATAYIRLPFVVTNTAGLTTLTLLMKYDDGFLAYLNGVEVARRNAPATPAWNSTATASRPNDQAVVDELIDLTPFLGALLNGTNVLAVHGLNESAGDNDFLIVAQLRESKPVNLTNNYFAAPSPNAYNTSTNFFAKVADTKFSHDRGFYETNFAVTITCATTGATIRCTLDGSAPTLANGFTYTNPIPITNTTTLRAAAFKTGLLPSDVDTHTYVFLRDVIRQPEGVVPGPGWPTPGSLPSGQVLDYGMDQSIVNNPLYSATISNDLRDIPSFSLVMNLNDLFSPATGIYANPSGDTIAWERPGSLELIYPDGTKGFQINCGVRIRGGYSRDPNNPKHGFRMFFRQEYGAAKLRYPLFGDDFGAVHEFDKIDLRTFQNYSWSFGGDSRFNGLRDQFNRDMQLEMGGPGSRGRYFHLYINGHYWGLYNAEERPEESFGASYFGGEPESYDVIKTSGDMGYSIYATSGSLDAWFRLWQQATNGFTTLAAYQRVQGNNPDGTRNPAYENLLDVDNLIDYMLVHLYGGDLDAPISNFLGNNSPNNIFCLRSTNNTHGFRFITHDAEHTLLNVNEDRNGPYAAGDPLIQGPSTAFAKSNPGYLWTRLSANAEFRMRVADRVQKHFFNGGAATKEACLNRLMTRSNEIYRAIVGESARWGNAKRSPAFTRQDWIASVNSVASSFISTRTTVVLNQLRSRGLFPALNAPTFAPIGGLVPAGFSLALTNPNGAGQIYYTLDGSDPRLLGGNLSPTALAYSTNLVLNSHTFLRTRVKNGADWSALMEATFYVDQDFSKLIVSEIMYNPPGANGTSGDEFEFIEVKNVGDRTLDLSGLTFSGITFTFTNGTRLAPGQFFVLVRNTNHFAARYPAVVVNGVFSGRLDNAGEPLRILHPLGTTLLSFTYNDAAPWPAASDGFGFSLVPVNPNAPFDHDLARAWRASANRFGSPGADDPPPTIPPVVINEVLTHTLPPQVDTIELFNPTPTNVDLGGWFLSDDRTQPLKYRIPEGTLIPAGGYVVFDETQFNPNPGMPASFAFDSAGDQAYLFSADLAGNLTGYSHGFSFGGASLDASFGRYLNSQGEEHFPAQAALSFSNANAGPRVGPVVLNEIMYHPAAGDYEFIELKNLTGTAIPLYDPAFPTNAWRINGLGYTFPIGAVIPPNGYLLVVGTATNTFRTRYNVPSGVPILGPFLGTLQDSGERLELQMPGTPDTNAVPWIDVDVVRYNDKAPWPVAADGDGPSLQRWFATSYGNDPTNWFTSGITPGGDNIYNASPSVTLLHPTNGAAYGVPLTLNLQAAATDPDGTILRVEFFQNGVLLGEDTTAPYAFLWTNVPPGSYQLTARVTDNGFAVAVSSPVQITVIPPPAGTGTGLKAVYYDNMDFTGLSVTVTNATVDFDWGTGQPHPSIGADTFSVRWTGLVQPRYTDTYTFYTTSDDGVRLWVNDQLIINNWTDHAPTENLGSIALQAGLTYPIRMEMYENGGGAVARLWWSATFVPKEIIPQSQLYAVPPPIIVVQPASRYAGLGLNTTFSVVATNDPTGYQWFFNAAPIAGATNATLTLTNVQPAHEGTYFVIVTNAVGTVASQPATLTVILPPVITQQPRDIAVPGGFNASFTVAVGGTPPFWYQWRFYGTNLPGATNATLEILNAQAQHDGPYSVLVSNLALSVLSSNAYLTVSVPATITAHPTNVSFSTGTTGATTTTNTAYFSVAAVGMGPLSYQWTFWGTNLPGATNSLLLISNASLFPHAGPYACLVSDTVRSVLSSNGLLTIIVKPTIVVPPRPQSVLSNGTAAVTVLAAPIHPTLPLLYFWKKAGRHYALLTNQATLLMTNVTGVNSMTVVVSNSYGLWSSSAPANINALPDGDNDGVPDSLEAALGLNPTNGADGALDYDGDGMSNAAEWYAGTSLSNALSVLRILDLSLDPATGGRVAFRFDAISNKTYSVEYNDDLAAGAWLNLISLDAHTTNRVIWITNDLPPAVPVRFYRLKLPLNQ